MAHHVCGPPLLYSSGAPDTGAPLVSSLLMAHQTHGAPLLANFIIFYFSKTINGAPGHSAPLLVLTSNGAPVTPCATTIIFCFFLQNY